MHKKKWLNFWCLGIFAAAVLPASLYLIKHNESVSISSINNKYGTAAVNVRDGKSSAQPSSQEIQKEEQLEEENFIKSAKEPADAEFQKQLGEKYQEGYNAFFSKEYSKAIKLEEEVINLSPDFYMAYNLKGIALCYSGNFKEGMSNIDKSLGLKPDFGYGIFNKALAYELYGHYDDAIAWYKKDIQIENFAWSYYGIASIYGRRGDVANTVKYLKSAIDISADTKKEAKSEKDFDNVRKSIEFQNLIYN